jgi:hypothetical protein
MDQGFAAQEINADKLQTAVTQPIARMPSAKLHDNKLKMCMSE